MSTSCRRPLVGRRDLRQSVRSVALCLPGDRPASHGVKLPCEAPLSNPPALSVVWTSMERLEVELDDTTAAYFVRQGCVRRADMAAAASAALRELALRAEVDALATFLTAHPDYVAASDDEYDAALAELPAGSLYSP